MNFILTCPRGTQYTLGFGLFTASEHIGFFFATTDVIGLEMLPAWAVSWCHLPWYLWTADLATWMSTDSHGLYEDSFDAHGLHTGVSS